MSKYNYEVYDSHLTVIASHGSEFDMLTRVLAGMVLSDRRMIGKLVAERNKAKAGWDECVALINEQSAEDADVIERAYLEAWHRGWAARGAYGAEYDDRERDWEAWRAENIAALSEGD